MLDWSGVPGSARWVSQYRPSGTCRVLRCALVDEGGERHGSGLQVAGEELGLVGYDRFERRAEVDVEVAGVVPLDLAPRRGARVGDGLLGGVTESWSQMQNRIGIFTSLADLSGRCRVMLGATRAATSLMNVPPSGTRARYPGRASGAVISAFSPGAPASVIRTGSLRVAMARTSRAAVGSSRRVPGGDDDRVASSEGTSPHRDPGAVDVVA